MSFDAMKLAAALARSHRSREPVTADIIAFEPASVDDAYAVQAAVMAHLGASGGYKTGRPDPSRPAIMAPIPSANIRPSPARYAASEMRLYGIELEIAFRVESALPPLGAADYDDRLRQAVSAVPVIEMVDSRLADRDGASDLLKLADNQSGFGLVIGQPVRDFTALNLTNPSIVFTVNGEQIGPTSGQVPGNKNAFDVLKDLLEVVGDGGQVLRPLTREEDLRTGGVPDVHRVEGCLTDLVAASAEGALVDPVHEVLVRLDVGPEEAGGHDALYPVELPPGRGRLP
ncbi:MAG: hypothetical protein KKB37_12515, partial [Alphaproteobacteria bacterium]|nr:hypothetical protein [Alphaproteobacteria bacterium]